MAESVTLATTKLQRYFPDLTTGIALDLFNDIHSELSEQFALQVTTEDLTSLVAGTREYSLSEDVLAVWSAVYASSATASQKLAETSVDELDTERGNWRSFPAGTPRRFYLSAGTSGAVVGFDPVPDSSTASGYPRVTLHVSKRTALTGGGNLPSNLRSSRIYIVGAAWLFAEQMYPDRAPMFEAAYLREKGKLGAYLMRRQRRNPPNVLPRWLQRGRRV